LHHLLHDATINDWNELINFQTTIASNIYFYNSESKSVFPIAHTDKLNWPMVYFAGRFHKKHRFCSNKVFPIDLIHNSLVKMSHRIKWMAKFKGSPMPKLPFRTLKKFPGTPFTSKCERVVTQWLSEVHGRVMRAAQRNHSGGCSNFSTLTKFCYRQFQHSSMILLPNDKDGGFSFLPVESFLNLLEEVLRSSDYSELLPIHELSSNFFELHQRDYETLCKEVVSTFPEEEQYAVMKALIQTSTRERATQVATLKLLVKSHKGPEKVSVRNLHAMATYSFGGLATWLSWRLGKDLKRIPYLITNTQRMVRKLAFLPTRPGSVIALLDIKSYFMSGTSNQLLEGLEGFVNNARDKDTILLVAKFLLEHQYVMNPITKTIFQVVHGSGMGLPHSGELCDAVFNFLVEQKTINNQEWLDEFGVQAYCRFKDDIMLIMHQERVHDLFTHFGSIQSIFKLELSGIHHRKAHFLEVFVFIDSYRRLQFVPAFKPTALMRPLAESSSHHPRVLQQWPISRVLSLFQLSSGNELAIQQIETYIRRFETYGHTHTLLAAMRNKLTELNSPHLPAKAQQLRRKGVDLWISIPYHPAIRSLQVAIAAINKDPMLQALAKRMIGTDLPVILKVAWSNELLPSLSSLVNRTNSRIVLSHTEAIQMGR